MRKNLWWLGAVNFAVGCLICLPGKPASADEPRPIRPTVREEVRDAVRDARETARGDVRVRRPLRDSGLTFGEITARGLGIADAVLDSVAYRSGLRKGDFVISVDGHRLQNQADYERWFYAADQNHPVKVVVWRDGREQVVEVEPSAYYAAPYEEDMNSFGVNLDERYPDRIVVRRVLPNSPAFRAGLRDGDEITTWHGARVKSAKDFGAAIHGVGPGAVDFEYSREAKPYHGEVKFEHRETNRPEPRVR